MHQVTVIGCGGIGLPLAVALASRGAGVTGVDIDPARVAALSAGVTGMVDRGLDAALEAALSAGGLRFSTSLGPSVGPSAYVITVPTSIDDQGRLIGAPLDAALTAIAGVAHDGDLVIVRSTTPVGTARRLHGQSLALGRRLLFAACPDRSVSGLALAEQFSTPNIIGGLSSAAVERASAMLGLLGDVRVVSSAETAEAVKLFANVWRDSQFAIANQLALFCEGAGLDFDEIRNAGAAGYPRFDVPRAGPIGGPCLTKDVFLLAESARPLGLKLPLLLEARRSNAGLVDVVCRRVCREVDQVAEPAVVAILGLAFKGTPAIVDRRGSFGLALAAQLRSERPDLEIRTWDPASDPDLGAAKAATIGAHVVVLANDHPSLNDARLFGDCAPGALVYDLCGVLENPRVGGGVRIARFGSGFAAERRVARAPRAVASR